MPDDFKTRLKQYRVARGWSQSDLAARCGLKPSAISHFEDGRRQPNMKNLVLLADTLSVSIDWLCCRMLSDNPTYTQAKRIMRAIAKMSNTDQRVAVQMVEILADKKKQQEYAHAPE